MTIYSDDRYAKGELIDIGVTLQEIGNQNPPVSSNQLRVMREQITVLERQIATVERRARQAENMDRIAGEPVRWLGDINTFSEDMIFHATRLGRDVRGLFNDVLLVASPSSSPQNLFLQYDEGRELCR